MKEGLKECILFYEYELMSVYASPLSCACEGQNKVSEPLKMELPVVVSWLMWVLGSKLVFSATIARAFNTWALTPVPKLLKLFLKVTYFFYTHFFLTETFLDKGRYLFVVKQVSINKSVINTGTFVARIWFMPWETFETISEIYWKALRVVDTPLL